MKKILILLVLFLVTGFFAWQVICSPKDPGFIESKSFLIEEGQSVQQITQNLKEESLIKNSFYFKTYVWLKGESRRLQAGKYLLSPSMTLPEIAQKFISGDVVKIKTTIPEGFTIKQIEERLNKQTNLGILRASGFKSEFEFLKDVPSQASLEGFLFPDTYQFFGEENVDKIARQMLNNFDKKLSLELREEITAQGKSIFEIVTMASLIEKEVRIFEDKELASGIFWKRLRNNIPLQSCATITYITGKKTAKVLIEETEIDSPYNTYKYLGLPPGPICNPGLESILAAMHPQKSEFWYFLSTPEGETIFSKTLEKHNLAKAKYL